MKPNTHWTTHILRGLLIVIATALLTLAVLQRVIVDPQSCAGAITKLATHPWENTLAQATLDAIPESQWSPYIARDANTLTEVYAKSITIESLEPAVCNLATSISRYWLGVESSDTVRNDIVTLLDHFNDDWSHRTHAALWESLPDCDAGSVGACVPTDPGLRNEYALEHAAWWQDYAPKLKPWLGNSIIQQVNTLRPFLPWLMRLHLLDILPIAMLIVLSVSWRQRSTGVPQVPGTPPFEREPDGNNAETSHSLPEPRRPHQAPVTQPTSTNKSDGATNPPSVPLHDMETEAEGRVRSVPWLISGGLLCLLSIIALFINLSVPRTPIITAAAWQPITNLAWQSLWRAFLPSFGWRALTLGASVFAVGLVLTALSTHPNWLRWLMFITTVLVAVAALLLDRTYRDRQLPVISNSASQPTPTTWPTLTPTPTVTPTPTPIYWPVGPGTPVPTPAAPLDSNHPLTSLGCFDAPDDAPIQWLHAESASFTVYQPDSYTRYALPSLSRISHGDNVHTLDDSTTYLVDKRVAVVNNEDLWVYNIPTWTPAMPSRFAAFANITAVYSDPYVSRDRMLLGLEDGFVWEVRPSSGALLSMRDVSDNALTKVALCDDTMLASDPNGLLRVWDWAKGTELALWQHHNAPVTDLICGAENTFAFSLDTEGSLIQWDLDAKRFSTQRALGTEPTTPIIYHNGLFWLGTREGDALAINPDDLTPQRYNVTDTSITALAIRDDILLITGDPGGNVCLWSSVAP